MIARRASLSSPSRRVVVVRNPRNGQGDQGMYYMADGRRPNSLDRTPVYTNGSKHVYLMRRPVVQRESPRILTPTRSPPIIITHARPRSRTPSPARAYYTKPAPPVVRAVPTSKRSWLDCCWDPDAYEPDYGAPSYVVDNVHHQVSGQPVSVVNPDDPWRTTGQYPPYARTTQVSGITNGPPEFAGKRPCWYEFLELFSRNMCCIVTIALIVLAIAIAAIIVCATYLGIDSSTNTGLKISGIVTGAILALGIIAFLFFLLCCLGKRDGFFSYFGKRSRIGGQGYALVSRTHHQNVYDYPPVTRTSNVVYSQQAIMPPESTGYENKPNKQNIVIEMPDHLSSGRKMSAKSRERSLNKVAQNINQIVEDARNRNNGDVPSTVIVKVD